MSEIKSKTPEEIERALIACFEGVDCDNCPYEGTPASGCTVALSADVYNYIRKLKTENATLKAELEKLRELAVEPIPENAFPSDEELRGEEYWAGDPYDTDDGGL